MMELRRDYGLNAIVNELLRRSEYLARLSKGHRLRIQIPLAFFCIVAVALFPRHWITSVYDDILAICLLAVIWLLVYIQTFRVLQAFTKPGAMDDFVLCGYKRSTIVSEVMCRYMRQNQILLISCTVIILVLFQSFLLLFLILAFLPAIYLRFSKASYLLRLHRDLLFLSSPAMSSLLIWNAIRKFFEGLLMLCRFLLSIIIFSVTLTGLFFASPWFAFLGLALGWGFHFLTAMPNMRRKLDTATQKFQEQHGTLGELLDSERTPAW